MKKLSWLVASLAAIFVLGICLMAFATDNTKRVSYYDDKAYTASDVVEYVIDGGDVGNQLKRRIIITNVAIPAASYGVEDSVYALCAYVPAGSTRSFEIDSIYLYTVKEGDIDTVADPAQFRMFIEVYDASAAALDTLVDDMGLDAESLVYSGTPYLLTQNTTSYGGQLDAGDYVLARFWAIGRWITVPEGLSIIIVGRYDE